MFTSLRARLLAWYTTMVVVVIAAFGGLVCLQAWRARVAEVDAVLGEHAILIATALRPAGDGAFDLDLPVDQLTAAGGLPVYHALWDAAGQVLDRSDLGLEPPPGPGARSVDGRREVAVRGVQGSLVVVGRDLAEIRAEIARLAATMTAVGAAAVLVSLAGGWLLVGRALAPIDRIGRTARQMTEGDFTARIPIDRVETELEQLGRALNEAFAKLYQSLEMQRRFTADASHELRTPLATIMTETQTILARDRPPAEYRDALAVCRRAADRMRGVVERLLLLARADAGEAVLACTPLSLDALVRRVADDVRPLAAERGVDLAVRAAGVAVDADADRLGEAITNLVTNAIVYNTRGGSVDLTVEPRGPEAHIRVADSGIGIDAADLPHVFSRFYRADRARARVRGGAGLGLAVTRSIIEQHGGRVTCASELGRGSTFTIVLPASALVPAKSDDRVHAHCATGG
jgi:heavy metal sensor kinase